MSRSTESITFDVTGQTVSYRVPQGRPTSATFSVFHEWADDNTTAAFSGAAAVTAPSTTITLASGASEADPQKLNLVGTSFLTSRKYLIAEGSRQEWVQPIEVATGYIRVRHPLKNDYTTAATVVSTTITAAIDATFVATIANLSDLSDPNPGYRVRWSILVGSDTVVAYSYFDLVRTPVTHQVDLDDLNARAPGLVDSMPVEYAVEQGRPLLDAAWLAVQAKMASLRIDTDAFRDDQATDELVTLKALAILAAGGWRPAGYASLESYITATSTDWDRFVEQHYQSVMAGRLALGSGGGAEPVVALPYWSK